MPKEEKVTLNDDSLLDVPAQTAQTADTSGTSTEPSLDDFLGVLGDVADPLGALSEDSAIASAEDETGPEESPDPEEVEGKEVEDEPEEPSEDTADPERKGKSRNERWKAKLSRLEAELATKDTELERLKKHEPLVDMVLEEARLRRQEPTAEEPQFKAPERPKRPTKPTNFSRERASEDPESASFKYLDDIDDYRDAMDEYALDKEDYEFKVNEQTAIKAQKEQAESAQVQWVEETNAGLLKEALKDESLSDEEAKAEVQKVLKVLNDPKTYDPAYLYRFGKAVLNVTNGTITATTPAKAPAKPAAKADIPPVPSVARGNASIVNKQKGWVVGDDADEAVTNFHKMLERDL